ncbi:MAG: histidine kinase dimerization/phospho-acceptor domain-containing protein, partial [Thermodesulfovibrionales bacterium]
MRIREKIFLGFALYVVLAAILGFLSYRELRTISTRLRLVEIADDITNTILEVRRYEKLFLLLPENDSRHQLEQYLSHLRTDIDAIQEEIILEIGRQNHDMMRSAIREYEILFNKVAATLLKEAELTGRIRSEARRIERLLSDDSRGAFLEARKEEKNLMLFEDRASYEAFLLKLAVPPLSGRHDIGQYLSLVKALAGLYEREQKSVSAMRRKAQEIQSFTESLAKREREEIERILALSMRMLVGALVFILVVGIVINVRLASKISSPMRTLEMVTRRIAAGDFSETVSVEGTDEIASLQRSFNAMQEKLRDALKDLEMTVAQLRDKQSQLVEAEKLASIGILAAGIAHEINNPLTSILTFSNLMLEQTPEGASQREQLKMMAREAERARYIVRQLLDFARETPLKLVRIDI